MHGDATLRPVWHTFRVDASFDKQRGITGIGLVLLATNKAGRDGAVVARFSESYIGLPIGYSGEGEHRFRREAERHSGAKVNSSRSEATLA
jgi:hypothetical protein